MEVEGRRFALHFPNPPGRVWLAWLQILLSWKSVIECSAVTAELLYRVRNIGLGVLLAIVAVDPWVHADCRPLIARHFGAL